MDPAAIDAGLPTRYRSGRPPQLGLSGGQARDCLVKFAFGSGPVASVPVAESDFHAPSPGVGRDRSVTRARSATFSKRQVLFVTGLPLKKTIVDAESSRLLPGVAAILSLLGIGTENSIVIENNPKKGPPHHFGTGAVGSWLGRLRREWEGGKTPTLLFKERRTGSANDIHRLYHMPA